MPDAAGDVALFLLAPLVVLTAIIPRWRCSLVSARLRRPGTAGPAEDMGVEALGGGGESVWPLALGMYRTIYAIDCVPRMAAPNKFIMAAMMIELIRIFAGVTWIIYLDRKWSFRDSTGDISIESLKAQRQAYGRLF